MAKIDVRNIRLNSHLRMIIAVLKLLGIPTVEAVADDAEAWTSDSAARPRFADSFGRCFFQQPSRSSRSRAASESGNVLSPRRLTQERCSECGSASTSASGRDGTVEPSAVLG